MTNLPLPPAQALAAHRGERITVRRPMEPQPVRASVNYERWHWLCPNGHEHVWGEGRDPNRVAFVNECAPHKPGDVVAVQGHDLSLVCVSVAAEMGEVWEWVEGWDKEGA